MKFQQLLFSFISWICIHMWYCAAHMHLFNIAKDYCECISLEVCYDYWLLSIQTSIAFISFYFLVLKYFHCYIHITSTYSSLYGNGLGPLNILQSFQIKLKTLQTISSFSHYLANEYVITFFWCDWHIEMKTKSSHSLCWSILRYSITFQ